MGFNGLIWCSCLVFVSVFVSMFGVCIGGAGFNVLIWCLYWCFYQILVFVSVVPVLVV